MPYMQENQVIKKLEIIQKELKEIKEHMVDIDNIMTEEDYEALRDYRGEKKSGKLISHAHLKKELGLDA